MSQTITSSRLFLSSALGPAQQIEVVVFQFFCYFLHEVIPAVICLGVCPHQPDVTVKFSGLLVNASSQLELNGLQVNGGKYFLVVVGGSVAYFVHGL